MRLLAQVMKDLELRSITSVVCQYIYLALACSDRCARGMQVPAFGASVTGQTTFTRLWDADAGSSLPPEADLLSLLSRKAGKVSVRVTVRPPTAHPWRIGARVSPAPKVRT